MLTRRKLMGTVIGLMMLRGRESPYAAIGIHTRNLDIGVARIFDFDNPTLRRVRGFYTLPGHGRIGVTRLLDVDKTADEIIFHFANWRALTELTISEVGLIVPDGRVLTRKMLESPLHLSENHSVNARYCVKREFSFHECAV